MSQAITEAMVEAAKAAYWHEVHNGGGYSDKCYEAAISAALSCREPQATGMLRLDDAVRIYLEALDGDPEKDAMDEDNVSFSSDWSHRKHAAEIEIALADVRSALAPPAVPGEVERENAKLVELIKTRFLGVHPDELDCYLEYDDWTRIIAALSVPLPEIEGGDKGDGWQPIETAPKNWTDVLLFDPGYRNDHRKVFEGYFEAEMEIWCDAGCEPVSPTHWRPLPAAPSASIEGETL